MSCGILHLLDVGCASIAQLAPLVTLAPGIASKPGRSTTRKAASAGGGRVELDGARWNSMSPTKYGAFTWLKTV